jgi:hypothetical protein
VALSIIALSSPLVVALSMRLGGLVLMLIMPLLRLVLLSTMFVSILVPI